MTGQTHYICVVAAFEVAGGLPLAPTLVAASLKEFFDAYLADARRLLDRP